jgi:N-acetylmuramoyl-L-alanine amidase
VKRPSSTALIGIGSALLLLGGGAWIAVDALTGSENADHATPSTTTATTGELDESRPPANTATSTDESTADDGSHAQEEAPAADGPLAALDGVTVGLDPGHNGGNAKHAAEISKPVDAGGFQKACDTTGTVAKNGTTESAYAFDLASRVISRLKAAGATVVVTRTTNTGVGPCIDKRAEITNRAEVALSLHADGNNKADAHGFHVIVPADDHAVDTVAAARSRQLGDYVRDKLRAVTGLVPATYLGDDGIDIRSDLGGLNLSTVPKVLVETGNMKSAGDMKILGSDAGKNAIADAIVAGLASYLTAATTQTPTA